MKYDNMKWNAITDFFDFLIWNDRSWWFFWWLKLIETDEWIKSIDDKRNPTNGLFSSNIIASYIGLFNRSIILCFYGLQLQSPVPQAW